MGFLKHLRSKSRLNQDAHSPQNSPGAQRSANQARYGRDFTVNLPNQVLEKIFIEICPHSQDETYEPSERSAVGDGCMLCDLRDLAKSAQVCRKWYSIAQNLL